MPHTILGHFGPLLWHGFPLKFLLPTIQKLPEKWWNFHLPKQRRNFGRMGPGTSVGLSTSLRGEFADFCFKGIGVLPPCPTRRIRDVQQPDTQTDRRSRQRYTFNTRWKVRDVNANAQCSGGSKYNIPWEPKTFIFRGYDAYIEGLKPSFFMVLGSKGIILLHFSKPCHWHESWINFKVQSFVKMKLKRCCTWLLFSCSCCLLYCISFGSWPLTAACNAAFRWQPNVKWGG